MRDLDFCVMPCPLFQSKEYTGVWGFIMPESLKLEYLFLLCHDFSLSLQITLKAMNKFSSSLQRDLNN